MLGHQRTGLKDRRLAQSTKLVLRQPPSLKLPAPMVLLGDLVIRTWRRRMGPSRRRTSYQQASPPAPTHHLLRVMPATQTTNRRSWMSRLANPEA
jgi:hypothetical protein